MFILFNIVTDLNDKVMIQLIIFITTVSAMFGAVIFADLKAMAEGKSTSQGRFYTKEEWKARNNKTTKL
jgi:hypothetical protein